jgi:hypothetical protein
MAFTRVGTFTAGATLTDVRQTLLWEVSQGGDGHEYGWSGAFPKVVAAGGTTLTTGGVGAGAWVDRTDVTLRDEIRETVFQNMKRSYAETGLNMVDGSFEAGGTLVNANDVLLQERTGKAFSGPAGAVAAGTNPASGGFTDKSVWPIATMQEFNAGAYGLHPSNTGLQNCKALQALAAAVKAADGGKVIFPSGVYTVGAQIFAGATGKGYAYKYEKMFEISGLTKPLFIEFQGVKFQFADGLRYGSFDPVTGNPINPALPYYNQDSTAQTGRVIYCDGCAMVYKSGAVEIDGRDTTRILGGNWGDKGRQLIEYGIQIVRSNILAMSGAYYLHNLCLDGLYVGNNVGDNCSNDISGVISVYNGRQGLSLAGGSNFTFTSCTFGLTGFGACNTAPAAGVDVEPEINPLRGATFNRCNILRAKGAALVAENFNTQGLRFNDCLIENDVNVSIYCNVSNTKFSRCTIRGVCQPVHPGTHSGQENTGTTNLDAYPIFEDCSFYNRLRDGSPGYKYPQLVNTFITKIRNCTMYADMDTTADLAVWADNSQVDGLRLIVSGAIREVDAAIAYFRNHRNMRNFYVVNKTTSISGTEPALSLRVEFTGRPTGGVDNCFIEKSVDGIANIRWDTSYFSGGSRAGFYMDIKRNSSTDDTAGRGPAWKRVGLAKRGFAPIDYYKPLELSSNQAIPTSGEYVKGDIVLNSDPVAAGAFGWQCTTTGTAGSTAVFKLITNIGA